MLVRLGLMACAAVAVAVGVGGCQGPLAPAESPAVASPVPGPAPLRDAARNASRALRVAGGVALSADSYPDRGAAALAHAASSARAALRRMRALRGRRGRQERARRALVAQLGALVDDLDAAPGLAKAGLTRRLRTIGLGLQPEIRRMERLRAGL